MPPRTAAPRARPWPGLRGVRPAQTARRAPAPAPPRSRDAPRAAHARSRALLPGEAARRRPGGARSRPGAAGGSGAAAGGSPAAPRAAPARAARAAPRTPSAAPRGERGPQRGVERLIEEDPRVARALLAELQLQRPQLPAVRRQVPIARRARIDRHRSHGLELLERHRAGKGEFELGTADEVRDERIVTQRRELPYDGADLVGSLVEVRDEDGDAASGAAEQRALEGRPRGPDAPGLELLELAEHAVIVLAAAVGPAARGAATAERHEGEGVALAEGEQRERGREHAPEGELRDAVLLVPHRVAGIEHDAHGHRRLGLGFAHEVAVRPREEPPIEPAEVVAGLVAAVLAELEPGALQPARVHAEHEAVHHAPGHQRQVTERRERARVEQRHRSGLDGAFTPASSRSVTWSAVTPSASARKFTSTRWRSTGGATARRSSRVTAKRPSSSARALAQRTSAWPARGPAPHRTSSRTSPSDVCAGREARTRRVV